MNGREAARAGGFGAMLGSFQEGDPVVLLVHDGELDDVRILLCEGGLGIVECRCVPVPGGTDADWALVVATPKRMLELDLEPDPSGERIRVAIGDAESKTLRKTISRTGVDFCVRRPVHPDALRLLLLHVLYRGPEKRRAHRVRVGAPTHYRIGLRKHPAILLDLSISGCRLLLFERGVEPGIGLTIFVPADRDSSQYLKVRGEVIRFSRAPSDREGWTAHVAFDALPAKLAGRVQQAVGHFAEWPAAVGATPQAESRLAELSSPEDSESEDLDETLTEDGRAPEAGLDEPASVAEEGDSTEVVEPPIRTIAVKNAYEGGLEMANEHDDGSERGGDCDDELKTGDDRRTEPRHIFTRRVVALREDTTRVLIGRDLSPSGMRTDPDPNLELGDELSVAFPLKANHMPLVVRARVVRDDAERGIVLQFVDLSEQQAAFLKQHASRLPICDSPYSEEEPAWVIVSEIVDP